MIPHDPVKVGSDQPSTSGRLIIGNWLRVAATDRSQYRWRHERSGVERQLIGRRIAGDMSVPASDGN